MFWQILAVFSIIGVAIGGYSYATTGTPLGAYSVFSTPTESEGAGPLHSATTGPNETLSPPAQGNDPVGPLGNETGNNTINSTINITRFPCNVSYPYNTSYEYVSYRDFSPKPANKTQFDYTDKVIYKALVGDFDCETEYRGRVGTKPNPESNILADIKAQITAGKIVVDRSKEPPKNETIRSKTVLTK